MKGGIGITELVVTHSAPCAELTQFIREESGCDVKLIKDDYILSLTRNWN